MKIEQLIAASSVILVVLCASLSSQAQGTFQNLNFEQANPISVSDPADPYLVTVASALPFWSVYYGNFQQTEMIYNGVSTGVTAVTLVGSGDQYVAPIDGNYSVLIQGIVPGSTASISQTGLVPPGTQSLLFEATDPLTAVQGPLEEYLGTQTIPFFAVGTGPNYTLYGANISAWAGQTEELTFLAPGGTYNNWEIDDITFSPNPVPEPSTLALMLTAVGAYGVRRWRTKDSNET